MTTLFNIPPELPEGFEYYPDFLSEEEELFLVNAIQQEALEVLNFQGFLAKRKVASYGYGYHFDSRTITPGPAIPNAFKSVIAKTAAWLSVRAEEFEEILLTEYPVGAVINWHRDAPPFDMIAGISLLSDCVFRLRPYDKKLQNRNSIISFNVARRSLYMMKDEARSAWEHSIRPVKNVRYSITLRTLR